MPCFSSFVNHSFAGTVTVTLVDSGPTPIKPKRASSIKTIKVSPPSSARSSLTPPQDKPDEVIAPAPRRLSAVSITGKWPKTEISKLSQAF